MKNPGQLKGLAVTLLTLLALTTAATAQAAAPKVKSIDPPQRILFFGNSFTYYNDSLHNHLGALMRAGGVRRAGESRLRISTISGGYLREHAGGMRMLVVPDAWDVVVLQGHSTAFSTDAKAKNFAETAAIYVRHIRQAGAEPVFFMTWAYKDRPEMLRPLERGYTRVANRHKALVVPVGPAFARAARQLPDLELYSPDVRGFRQGKDGQVRALYRRDVKHTSVAGTYLAACVFYAALFGQSPQGLVYHAGLGAETAAELQRVAQETVAEFYHR